MVLLLAAASLPASALFTLQRIDVEGTQTLTPEAVRSAAALVPGSQSIFTINAQEVARRLARHPWISTASVHIRPPHTVRLRVRERTPVAAVPAARGYVLVDNRGIVVAVQPERPALRLVSERGRALPWVAPGEQIPSAPVRTGLTLLGQLPPELDVAHLQVTPAREVVLYTADGLEIRAGPIRGLRERLAVAPEVLRQLRAQGMALEYVDLSLPDQAIIKPRDDP
jgi:cell division protein FtsQ